MSRIGKLPVAIPQGVKVSFSSGTVTVEGSKGKLSYKPADGITVKVENSLVHVELIGFSVSEKKGKENNAEVVSKQLNSNYGTTRALINNMILGVSKGWKKTLQLNGVGYTAKLQGNKLTLAVGYSHDVVFELPKEIKCAVTKESIDLESCDRVLLGEYAARIRKSQPPEPYLGKGIKYSDEVIRRKAGKTGKK
jgi:large subunit ribosomal protein L6